MTNGRGIGQAIGWLITLALPFMLVAASVRLLLSHEFLSLEYQRPGFPADPYGFTTADRLEYGMHAIDFLFGAGDSSALARLQIPRQKCWQPVDAAANCLLFNANELRHLEDVKQVLRAVFALAAVCALATFASLYALRSIASVKRQIKTGLLRGACLTLAAVLTLAVMAVAAWDSAFDQFHELFFAAGTWRFPYSDSLIRLYPEQLFIDASLIIGGLCAAAALVILLLTSLWEGRSA